MNIFKEAKKDSEKIIVRFRNKNFSGDVGQAVKNSSWQFSTNIIGKICSLIFTIILARILVPEVYGLYGLALSTILFIGVFSDLGLSSTLITLMSKTIDKNPGKAKKYFYYITKLKVFLVFLTSLILIILAKWVANSYYNKPIFYAILAGAVYIPFSSFFSWTSSLFVIKNKFKPIFFKEIIFQILRIIIIPILIIFVFNKFVSGDILLFWIFIAISFCYLISIFYSLFKIKSMKILSYEKNEKLSKKEIKGIYKFAIPLSITALSGSFFGFIDTIMLGHYVDSIFIAYYQASFNLINSASVILSFMGIALLPIFARSNKKISIKLFRKSRIFLFLISLISLIFTLLISNYLILFTYGENYLSSIFYLKVFSILLILSPMIELYTNYYTSKKRTGVIAVSLLISTFLNIVFNYIFINFGLNYGMNKAVLGACIATIISRFVYLGILGFFRKTIHS